MKKFFTILVSVLLISAMLCLPAAANSADTVDIDVVINDDGSARVTQVWDGSFTDGTENFIVIGNLGERDIKDFTVSDEKGAYTSVDGEWDVDDSFDEKARRCGVVYKDGVYELCWGISERGDNRYTASYTITGLVSAYEDYDGFNFQFLNPGMNIYPSDVTIKISLKNGELTDDIANIWAFNYHGDIVFRNGYVYGATIKPLESDDGSAITVMLQLDKGVVNPTLSESIKFDELKDKAIAGSDYQQDETLLFIIVGVAILLALVAVLSYIIYRKVKLSQLYKQAEYYRDTPQGGKIEDSFWLAKNFEICKKESGIIGAVLLRLINSGCLQSITERSVGIFGRQKEAVNLQLVHPPTGSDVLGTRVYMLLLASCGDDMVLQEKELSKYISKNVDEPREIIKAALNAGENSLKTKGCFAKKPSSSLGCLTEQGTVELKQLMGLKKYLLDFSLISERTIDESVIWEDYLVYAQLMGIADEVIDQFKKVYPENLPEYRDRYDNFGYNLWLASMYSNCYTNSLARAEAARAAGSGGHASFGGGGGFSGGGFGGGSR